MSSRLRHLTMKEYRDFFNQSLKDAIELGIPPENTSGLDPRTMDALEEIASEYPKSDGSSINKARNSFRDFMTWLTS